MASNLKDIKRRIKSVESTMQITKAMELVASSKLRKAKERADKAKPFFNSLYETMCDIATNDKEFSSGFTRKRKVKNTLLIIVAGDRGLAGGFNSNVLKTALKRAEELSEKGTVKVITIGKKATEFFEKKQYEMVNSYIGIAEEINIYDADVISSEIVSGYNKKDFDSVELVYTTMVSPLVQDAVHLPLLPIKVEKSNKTKTHLTSYDPSPEEVFNGIVPKYITGIIFGAVVDSFAAEQAARRTAMESASDNAGEMIDNLSLIYNRARQAAITQEITEIVAGAKAQG